MTTKPPQDTSTPNDQEHTPSTENIEQDTSIDALTREREEYRLGWQRAMADYQNLKKEVDNQRSAMFLLSEERMLEEVLPVYDNFKKAFAHHPELDTTDEVHKKIKNWIDGIGFIKKQFEDMLKHHGVVEIAIDGVFDPLLHEAVGEEESDLDAGLIVRAVESGYLLKDKVIKVAKVVVSKGKSTQQSQSQKAI